MVSLPLPSHPERLTQRWSEEETKVLQAYGQACREAALAELHVPEISFGNIVEPVYQFRQKPTWFDEDVEWTPWVDCSKATFDNLTSTDNWQYQVRKLYLHPPQPQATYSDSTPLLHVGNSSFEDWFQERDRAGKSDKQLAREAYAAGMGDPLVTYVAAQGEKPQATPPVPEGFALVPVEPTDEELAKGVRAMSMFVTKNSLIDFSLGYKAMLTAAQGEKL